jgi:Flp pilus assembly protein TadD
MMTGALMNTGKPEKVVAVLEPFRKAQPNSVHVAEALGQAYLQLHQYEKARRELMEAVRLDPGSARAHFALAQALARLGDQPNARKHREEYAKLTAAEIATAERMSPNRLRVGLGKLPPLTARFRTWAGQIYASHGRVDEAEQLWVASLAIDPTNPEARRLLGMLHSAQGRGEEARDVSRAKGDGQAPVRNK